MKRILTGIALTVCFTEGSAAFKSIAVPCGEGKYRHNPYCPVLGPRLSPEILKLSINTSADEPTTTIHSARPADWDPQQLKLSSSLGNLGSSIGDDSACALVRLLQTVMPDATITSFQGGTRHVVPIQTPISPSHLLYQTLVNGVRPIKKLVDTIDDCSVFTFTAEMANHPQVLKNYATYILPQLKSFVGMRLQTKETQDKQIQIYEILSNFFRCTRKMDEAVYMLMGKTNIYSIQSQNIEAFEALLPLIDLINRMEENDQSSHSMLGTVFLMMVRAAYYMNPDERAIYKPMLDGYISLCNQHIMLRILQPDHIKRLKALGYFERLQTT